MKLNTYVHTSSPKSEKHLTVLFVICAILLYGIIGLAAFANFYYAQSFVGGFAIILVAVFITATVLIAIKDIEKSYIEIIGDEIYVVDYVLGIKREERFSFSDITSAQIHPGQSPKIRGYRLSVSGMFIVFYSGKKYLFKITYLPETEKIFKQYMQ